jgi:hypothetical protein
MNVPAQVDAAGADAPAMMVPGLTRFDGGPVMRREPDRAERINEAALIRDVWYVLARASTDNAPRTLAAARDAVFGRYLPMARTLATKPGPGSRPVDPGDAEQAAELGLAQAVMGWRRPDGDGFEVIARAAIAAQLRRLPAANPEDRKAHPSPGGRPATGDRQSPGQT